MRPRYLLAFLGLVAAGVGCRKEQTPGVVISTVRAGTVDPIHADTPERYSATILPSAQVDLAFKSAGLIEQIHQVRGADGRVRNIQAGDKVDEGAELAVVRRIDYEQRVQQARIRSSRVRRSYLRPRPFSDRPSRTTSVRTTSIDRQA
jgi:hypothetical protein